MRLARLVPIFVACAAPAAGLHAQDSRLDRLDAYVREQMARRQIPGVSLAIIQDGRIVAARGYGVADQTSQAPVTAATLFQAGSISKPVSALGALHLVEAGRLLLDEDVNANLTSWKIPRNRFTAADNVTLRRLLSHSAGVTVHGFPGYDAADQVPSLVQVLDGVPPANTPAIRVDTTPGAIWRYSGGGFTIMQQMLIDVTGMPFPRFMQETVLGPIGMTGSSFAQPQPPEQAALTAAGYYANRTPVRGRWHLYPEMAAAGLWTTPTDLARFAIEVQETLAGRGHGVISSAMARQYVTEQNGGSGLGIGVNGRGRGLSFSHGGRDEGFDARLVAFAETGQGAVIMINANDNSRFVGRIIGYISRAWGWPGADAGNTPAATQGVHLAPAWLARFGGYYEIAENQMITLVPNADGTGLLTLADGLPDEEFLAIDSLRFGSNERPVRIDVVQNPRGAVSGIVWRPDDRQLRASLVVPLPSSRNPSPDPDAGLTRKVTAALEALRQGGSTLADASGITPGAKRDFSAGVGSALDGLRDLNWLGDEHVAGRGIHRHGGDVATVRYYQVTTAAGQRYLLVHLTEDGMVTDLDLVAR